MKFPWPSADSASVVAKGTVKPGIFVDFTVGINCVPIRKVPDMDFPRVNAYNGAYMWC